MGSCILSQMGGHPFHGWGAPREHSSIMLLAGWPWRGARAGLDAERAPDRGGARLHSFERLRNRIMFYYGKNGSRAVRATFPARAIVAGLGRRLWPRCHDCPRIGQGRGQAGRISPERPGAPVRRVEGLRGAPVPRERPTRAQRPIWPGSARIEAARQVPSGRFWREFAPRSRFPGVLQRRECGIGALRRRLRARACVGGAVAWSGGGLRRGLRAVSGAGRRGLWCGAAICSGSFVCFRGVRFSGCSSEQLQCGCEQGTNALSIRLWCWFGCGFRDCCGAALFETGKIHPYTSLRGEI